MMTANRKPRLERLEPRLAPSHDTLADAVGLSFAVGPVADVSGKLATANQVDLYAIRLQAGDQLTADVSAQGPGEPLAAAVRLFDPNGSPPPIIDKSVGLDILISYSVASSGTYFVGVSSAGDLAYSPQVAGSGSNGTSTGSYQLSV